MIIPEFDLQRDSQGRVIYTYRGPIERGVGNRYVWREGWSPTTKYGGVIYPWMTKRECQQDARMLGAKAVFQR